MRFIPTKIHGLMDYLMGLVLIAAPWLFDFADGSAAMWVPIIIGASVILYSLFTDYEWGVLPRLSMRAHLFLDAIGGLFLALSPWLFGFSEFVYLPHLVFGIAEFMAALTTKTVPVEHGFHWRERRV